MITNKRIIATNAMMAFIYNTQKGIRKILKLILTLFWIYHIIPFTISAVIYQLYQLISEEARPLKSFYNRIFHVNLLLASFR